MAMPRSSMPAPVTAHARRRAAPAWLVWMLVSVVGAIVGALIGWQTRSLLRGGPAWIGEDLPYIATALSLFVSSGTQWLVLRRFGVDAYWWVPATMAAGLANVSFIVPPVFNAFHGQSPASPSMAMVILAGAIALAASGLVVGAVQGIGLRLSAGNIAWLWIPSTVLGGALAGALTTALSAQLLGLPSFATISVVAALAALMTSACQAPVVVRILR